MATRSNRSSRRQCQRRPFRIRALADPTNPATGLWADISNYTKALTDQGCADLKNAGIIGVIVQAVTGNDGISYTRQQLDAAKRNGLRIMGYVFPNGLAGKLPMFDGYTLEWLWLDVELPITIASVNAALALCDSYWGGLTGIYSGRWFWQQQGWLGNTTWANRPLWDSNYDHIADRTVNFRPYGGWTEPTGKQYVGTSDVGSVHQLDLSVF